MTEFIFGRNDHCKTVTDARARQIAAQELAEIKRAADAEVKAVMRRISAAGGMPAVNIALALLDDPSISLDEIEVAAVKAGSGGLGAGARIAAAPAGLFCRPPSPACGNAGGQVRVAQASPPGSGIRVGEIVPSIRAVKEPADPFR